MRQLFGFLCMGAGLLGQSRIPESANGSVVLNQSDMSVLESEERRRDIECVVKPRKAELGFDLRLRGGYDVEVMLDGNESQELVTIVRVKNAEGQVMHLQQRLRTPEGGGERVKFEGSFGGSFLVGEGKYGVDLLVRDRGGRYCAEFWEFEAKAAPGLRLAAGAMAPETDTFSEEGPVEGRGDGLTVKVLVNYEPDRQEELLGMLRAIARDPRVGRVSLGVFNLEQRKVLVKQERVEFPALREALAGFQTGVVDAQVLSGEDGGVDQFLASLVDAPELGEADTVIFLGPVSGVDERLAGEWESRRGLGRMFYLKYDPEPWKTAFTDSIERVVQMARGKRYAIQQPKDWLVAWGEIVTRLVQASR